jgi:uncharacterized membrane protein YedE/YeeE
MGAISDVVSFGDWTRMRQWGMAVGVAMIGFSILAYGGWINPSRSIYAATRWLWLSALVGGFLFGFGMVLGSGCGSKTLVRIGSGQPQGGRRISGHGRSGLCDIERNHCRAQGCDGGACRG